MRTIFKRLRAETPSFFKKIIAICLSLVAMAVALEPFKDSLPPVFAEKIMPFCYIAGGVGAFFAKLTVKDPEKL